MLVLSGAVIAGVMAVSIGLAQRGTPGPSPMRSTKPLPPIASQANHIDRGDAARAQVSLGAQSGIVGEAATEAPAAVQSRPKSSPETRVAPIRKPTQRLALATAPAAPRSRSGGPCSGMGGLPLARCMRPQILDADRQLRDAYDDAVRGGVDRQVLVAYQRQWSVMRQRALSDPRGVAANYRQMALELDAQTDRRADDF
ncbi:MAG TPA: hypothetical protein VF470_02300 [Sphingomicrobium sp.]